MNEKREKLKPKPMANSVAATFCDEIPNMMSINNIFDIMPPKPSSSISSFGAGFMDLLAVHDYNPFLFDSIATTTNQIQNYHNLLPSPVADGSEVLNTPVSPNSTSISSSLNEAATAIISTNNELLSIKAEDEEDSDRGRGDNHDQQHKTKNQLKQKKKKQRVAIFAFMTKSEVDQLDDGYRWRKYGQKAVKNSPYPRSYYRCTTVGCGVKKRVERSSEDSTIVVTTYEGQHIHPCPATTRASLGFMQYANNSGVLASHPHHFVLPYQFHQALLHDSTITTLPLNSTTEFVNASDFFQDQENHHHQGFVASRTTCLRDNGLLQDIVPTQMRKEKKEEHE